MVEISFLKMLGTVDQEPQKVPVLGFIIMLIIFYSKKITKDKNIFYDNYSL